MRHYGMAQSVPRWHVYDNQKKLFDAYRRIFYSINTGVAQQDVCPAIRFLQDDQNNTILLT